MLFLHCGWFKTGTTSLRDALAKHRDRLADAGIAYVPEWRFLTKALAGPRADAAVDEFRQFLEEQAGGDVLYSNEWLTSLIWRSESRDALVRLISAAGEAMPVRCIWTLRRIDEAVVSLYLWQLQRGEATTPVEELGSGDEVATTIHGMRLLEEESSAAFDYVKYEPSGRHGGELLRSMGLTGELLSTIERDVAEAPRLNVGVTHKQAVALLNADAISERSGTRLDQDAIRSAFVAGTLRFEEDGPCRLIDTAKRRRLHEEALNAARESGFEPYVRFFGDAEIAETPAPPDLTADALSDEDLGLLVERVQSTAVA